MDIAYHKGKRFILIGAGLYLVFFTCLSFLTLSQSAIFIFHSLRTISFLILIWGSFLVLRAKGRHWAWLFLFPILNLFALLVVFSLKDKASQEPIPFNNEVILAPKKTWIWAGIVPLLFVIGMFVGWASILESPIRPPAIIGSWITTITQTNRKVITKIAIAKDNPDICLNVGWTDACDGGMPCRRTYQCYHDFAISRKRIDVCDLIKDVLVEEAVIDECYVESANDPANQYHYCGHIKDIYKRGDCYGEMAAVANKPDICDELLNSSEDPEFLQGSCYVNYVKGYYNRQWGDFLSRYHHYDESFCSKIVDLPRSYSSDNSPQYFKNWCYSIIAYAKKNPDLCLRISNLKYQNSCIRDVSPSK